MGSKRWDQAYSRLLQLFDITKLSECRLYLDLCTMFKIVHGLFNLAVSNRWTGLWTGSVDWIAGLDYWIQPNCQ